MWIIVNAFGRVIGYIIFVPINSGIIAFGLFLTAGIIWLNWTSANAPWLFVIIGLLLLVQYLRQIIGEKIGFYTIFLTLFYLPVVLFYGGFGGFLTYASMYYPGDSEITRAVCRETRIIVGGRNFFKGKSITLELPTLASYQLSYSKNVVNVLVKADSTVVSVEYGKQYHPRIEINFEPKGDVRVYGLEFTDGTVITCEEAYR